MIMVQEVTWFCCACDGASPRAGMSRSKALASPSAIPALFPSSWIFSMESMTIGERNQLPITGDTTDKAHAISSFRSR
jgi:hypothetical protein